VEVGFRFKVEAFKFNVQVGGIGFLVWEVRL
jgi:hypothetical protein